VYIFYGHHQNRLDAKRRVSVPSQFRTVMNNAERIPLILRPSHEEACIEAWPVEAYALLKARLDQHEILSPAWQAWATVIYSAAFPVDTDKEGRVMLPEDLAAKANLRENDPVMFLGRPLHFQIWEPAAGLDFMARSAATVRA
jgi:MraZ protein